MLGTISLDESNITYASPKMRNRDDFVRIGEVDGVQINASITSYFTAHLYRPVVMDLAVMDATAAIHKWGALDAPTNAVRILESQETDDYDALWVVSDKQGITFMFPEEY